MRWVALVLGMLAGCDRLLGLEHVGDGGTAGSGDDGDVVDVPDGPAGALVIGGLFFTLTVDDSAAWSSSLSYDATTFINTDDDSKCTLVRAEAGKPTTCVIEAAQISVNAGVVAYGARPLVLAASGDVVLGAAAEINVSSKVSPPFRGAGGSFTGCNTNGGAAQLANATHAGGGAGGAFGGAGGAGGPGEGTQVQGDPGGAATFVRGGCRGGSGGAGVSVGAVPGGDGGGAVYVIAGGDILVAGAIKANGAGGLPGNGGAGSFAGGAGAGAGGLIALDAGKSITMTGAAVLVANGGAGGGGADGTFVGQPGDDGDVVQARGGRGALSSDGLDYGGQGGAGSTATTQWSGTTGFAGAPGQGGGGGGGGGAGVIRVRAKQGVTLTNVYPPTS